MEIKEDGSKQAACVYDIMAMEYTNLFWDDHTDDSETGFFLKLLPQKGNILDAGCGPGNIARYLVSKGFDVIGVDLSSKLIHIAKEKVHEAKFHVMDMRKLTFPNESFNGVYSAYSFMHISNADVATTLKSYYKVLKPSGCLFLATKAGSGEIYLKEPLAEDRLCYFNFYDPKWLMEQVESSGFIIKEFVKKASVTEGELPYEKLIYICTRK